MAGDHKFPRWAGPILGAGVGVVFALRAMRQVGGLPGWFFPVGGAFLGALGGGVVWLIDAPANEGREASMLGSILAALAVFPGVLPLVGLAFSIPAFLVNRQVSGWQNRASRLGLGVCVVLTIVLIAVIVATQVL